MYSSRIGTSLDDKFDAVPAEVLLLLISIKLLGH
jgi:hypothetical protein